MAIGTAIVVAALIFLLVVRPGFALGLLIVAGGCVAAFIGVVENQTVKRVKESEEAKRMALTAIRPADLSLSDVTLRRTISLDGRAFTLKGTVTNNSEFPVKYIAFEVTIRDCRDLSVDAVSENCRTVGQDSNAITTKVPAGQTREFETTALTFKDLPDPWRCLDNAPFTKRQFTGQGSSESDKQAYSEGFVQGRRFLHPMLGFTFLAPEGFALYNTTDAVRGVNDGRDQALQLEVVSVPAEQTLAEYLNSGWIQNIDPKTVEEVIVNGLPAATATAKGDQWVFRLYAVRFGSDVYRFIYSSKGTAPEIDRTFRESVSTFRRMTLAEAECPKGRSFAWKITEIQAAGFGYY